MSMGLVLAGQLTYNSVISILILSEFLRTNKGIKYFNKCSSGPLGRL